MCCLLMECAHARATAANGHVLKFTQSHSGLRALYAAVQKPARVQHCCVCAAT